MKSSKPNLPITPQQIKLLQVARRSLNLSEGEYRSSLMTYGGVESAKELTQKGFEKVIRFFETCGFKTQLRPRRKEYPDSPPSTAQNKKILEMAKGIGWDMKRLQGFCKKQFKSLWANNREEAQKLIEALKGMEARGYGERSGR